MVTLQENKKALIGFGILTAIMYVIVMLIINPMIDGKTGFEVIQLQLSFTTENANVIIEGWGETGQQNFLRYIYTDYLYAAAYSFFLAVLYLNKLLKNVIEIKGRHFIFLILPFIAGMFDMLENTIEIFFIKNPDDFPELLFSIHSILASLKWLALPVFLYVLIKRVK